MEVDRTWARTPRTRPAMDPAHNDHLDKLPARPRQRQERNARTLSLCDTNWGFCRIKEVNCLFTCILLPARIFGSFCIETVKNEIMVKLKRPILVALEGSKSPPGEMPARPLWHEKTPHGG
jgi:hypothetical protein